ncbi:MAG: glycosyltransferase [Alphaproteobacteria bacterium]|nr:glycosyltransferase [Alphaproteobacteria bacterium]
MHGPASRLLIDLSQFAGAPSHSGIQRVLSEMLRHWPLHVQPADVAILVHGVHHVVPLASVNHVLERFFQDVANQTALQSMQSSLISHAVRKAQPDDLDGSYAGYFLPEPTWREDVLNSLDRWRRRRIGSVFALMFDALPQSNPEVFAQAHQEATSRYFRLVAGLNNVACISLAARQCLESRLRRQPLANCIVVPPGADALPVVARARPATPSFVMLGTVEPRKHHKTVLEAFERLWRSGYAWPLTIIGAPGWHDQEFLRSLRTRATAEPQRLVWLEAANDQEIAQAFAKATAVLYVSEQEGYGVPAVEALAAGCPVVAHHSLPALAGLSPAGQIRLSDVTPDSVLAAAQAAADAERDHVLSNEAKSHALPSWRDFAPRLAAWIAETLAVQRGT